MFSDLPDLDLSSGGGVFAVGDADWFLFERACVMSAFKLTPSEFDSLEMCAVLKNVMSENVGHVVNVVNVVEMEEESALSFFPNDPFTSFENE
jgi:hypothetical protein